MQVIYSGGDFTGSSSGLSGFDTFDLSMPGWFRIAGVALVVVTALGWIFVRSDVGRLLVAIRENEQRCRYFGIATARVKTLLLVGLGGGRGAGGLSPTRPTPTSSRPISATSSSAPNW